tara:strand:- start:9 stop:1028 length:1020 start_codon:yes stop_codon:yes gene_type:complete
MRKKPIVVSMGEPSGISSEIILKAWKSRKKFNLYPFFIVDNISKIESIIDYLKLNIKTQIIEDADETIDYFPKKLPIYNINEKIEFELGKPNKKNTKIILQSIKKSFEFVSRKKAKGLLTLPVCKKTLKSSGFKFNGQTEFIGNLSMKKFSHSNKEIMILSTTKPLDQGKNLIVGLVTTHIPLKDIFKHLTKKKIEEKLLIFYDSLKKIWKIKKPIIGITGLNPHSGEGGLIGSEEKKLIQPVIDKFNKNGMKIHGPLSADTCFFKKIRKNYDGILCLYHDQGLSPIKTLDFFNSINVTAGLPIIRVSPDHGPAFDIAKCNSAKINSVVSSIKFLEKYC